MRERASSRWEMVSIVVSCLLSGLPSRLNCRVLHTNLVDQILCVLTGTAGMEEGAFLVWSFEKNGGVYRCRDRGVMLEYKPGTLGEEVSILLQDRNPHLRGQTRSFALQNWVSHFAQRLEKYSAAVVQLGSSHPGCLSAGVSIVERLTRFCTLNVAIHWQPELRCSHCF